MYLIDKLNKMKDDEDLLLDGYEKEEEDDSDDLIDVESEELAKKGLINFEIESLRQKLFEETEAEREIDRLQELEEQEKKDSEVDKALKEQGLSLDQAAEYYDKGSSTIDKTIKGELKGKPEIVYGNQATNQFLPASLKVTTEDWDIATFDDPKVIAEKMERALDKKYGGDYFYVEPALHQGTYKVISKVTRRNVADVTLIDHPIDFKKVAKINYATLDFQVDQIKKSLADPSSEFRHNKDIETWQRIKTFQDKGSKASLKLGIEVEDIPKTDTPQRKKKKGQRSPERDPISEIFGLSVIR